MNNRDEFPMPVRRDLAHRAGFHCSRPDCDARTAGPSDESERATSNVGVAAHITAAAPGGKRHDTALTPDQRSRIDNGIWLCQTCAKMIDDDDAAFPAELLRAWKVTAEAKAKRELGRNVRTDPEFYDRIEAEPLLVMFKSAKLDGQSGSIKYATLEIGLQFKVWNKGKVGIGNWLVHVELNHMMHRATERLSVAELDQATRMILAGQSALFEVSLGFAVVSDSPLVFHIREGLLAATATYQPVCELGPGQKKSAVLSSIEGAERVYNDADRHLTRAFGWR